MAYQVKENFGNYLDVVGVTNHHSLELYDFSNVDYILTTVPIDIPVPIPIIRTSTFFETSFIHQVNQAITDTRSSRFKESGSNLHMRIISELSKNIMRNAWRESFMNAASADEALEILKLIEKEVI